MTLCQVYARAKELSKTGNIQEARSQLASSCSVVIADVVSVFVKRHSDHQQIADELKSSLSAALLSAIDYSLEDKFSEPENFTGYLVRVLSNAVKKAECEWNGLGKKKSAVHKQRNLCRKLSGRISEIESELLTSDLDRQSVLHDERDRLSLELAKASPLAKRALAPDDNEIAGSNPFAVPEIREAIDSCCQNEQELLVIELRSKAMTDSEVAEKTGLCRQTVLKIRKAVEARFNAKMKAMNREATAFVVSRRVTSSPCSVPSSLAIGA